MTRQFLRPADGRSIPLEDGRPWPIDGMEVEVTRYVRRRIADGDVEPVLPVKQTEAKLVEVADSDKSKKGTK